MAKVLVIGGTGLISTAIVNQLVERGDDVTVFNRGKTEARIPASVKRVYGDRKDYQSFESRMRELGAFDCVIDMVCYLPEDAESVVRAFRGRIGQLIFCSTVDVYNKPAVFYPYREDHPREAASDYGRNKAKCEDILMAAHERSDFKVTIIRPAHTYGEGGTLIHTFGWRTSYLDRIRKGKPVIQHGDGNSLWVVCHIDDVARAFVNAIGNERAYGKAYHTTGEEWLTWNRYLEIIAEAMDAPKPKIVHIPTDLWQNSCQTEFTGRRSISNTAMSLTTLPPKLTSAFNTLSPSLKGQGGLLSGWMNEVALKTAQTIPFTSGLLNFGRK